MCNILIVYMGGTFGCSGVPLAPMPAQLFLPKLQQLLNTMSIQCIAAPVVKDSTACSSSDWLCVIQFIQGLIEKGTERIVLIHGTDTLSYAAALLSRFLGHSLRLIITGSQLPLFDVHAEQPRQNSDAWQNLQFALQQVQLVPKGCYVAFAQQLIHARSSVKIQRNAWQAFADLDIYRQQLSLQQPPRIECGDLVHRITAQDITRSKQLNLCNIMLQPIAQQALLTQLKALTTAAPDFLILQGYGCGNIALTADISHTLKQLYTMGCVCILTSQVLFGELQTVYAVNGDLETAGLILDNSQSPADLYAKIVQIYLQYRTAAEWRSHWYKYD